MGNHSSQHTRQVNQYGENITKYKGDYFEIEFIYRADINIPKFDYTHNLSIDLGLDNFGTKITTRETAFIIEGRGIKSYNRWWNKRRAKLLSQYDKGGQNGVTR